MPKARTIALLLAAATSLATSFYAFARLFRDGLNCANALFLDGGSAPSLYSLSLNRLGNLVPLGPMLAVYEGNRGASAP
jgi:uncharacterized protein YigE (DUF2233 family)